MEDSLGYYNNIGIVYSAAEYSEEDIVMMCFEEEVNLCLKYQYPYKKNMGMPDVMIILSTYDNVLEDLRSQNLTNGCGTIARLPNGWGVSCGEMTGKHQYLCSNCSLNVQETNNG